VVVASGGSQLVTSPVHHARGPARRPSSSSPPSSVRADGPTNKDHQTDRLPGRSHQRNGVARWPSLRAGLRPPVGPVLPAELPARVVHTVATTDQLRGRLAADPHRSPGQGVGAPGRTRTSDTWFRKPLLYPLSYEGGWLGRTRGRTRDEPQLSRGTAHQPSGEVRALGRPPWTGSRAHFGVRGPPSSHDDGGESVVLLLEGTRRASWCPRDRDLPPKAQDQCSDRVSARDGRRAKRWSARQAASSSASPRDRDASEPVSSGRVARGEVECLVAACAVGAVE
jgi:hypothetical protein